jgi:hypothetical protein
MRVQATSKLAPYLDLNQAGPAVSRYLHSALREAFSPSVYFTVLPLSV